MKTRRERQIGNLHEQLARKNGPATHCENTDCPGISIKFDYALRHGHKYSSDIADYRQLCRSCHMYYDKPAATTTDRTWKYLTPWRRRNPDYARRYMRKRRKHYSRLYKKGQVKYEDIPKSYRTMDPPKSFRPSKKLI